MKTVMKGTASRMEIVPANVDDATPAKQLYSTIDQPSPMSLDANNVLRVGSTGLWGVWEMWCDFPTKATPSRHYGSHHATMTEKLAHYQPPTWLDSVKSIGVFDTAEGFWVIHDCTLEPSKLANGSNYYLFRQNVAPMWEHEANRRGGKWVAQFGSDQGSEVDQAWLNVCVALIGEALPGPEEEICGVCVAKRKSGFKISLWTRYADSEEVQLAIGRHLAQLLGWGPKQPNEVHDDKMPRIQGQLKYLRHCETLESCSPSNTHRGGSSPTVSGNSPTHADGAVPVGSKIPETLYCV